MNEHSIAWLIVLVFLLVSLSAPALSQSGSGDVAIGNVTYTGEAAVDLDTDETLIWGDGPHEFDVTLSSQSGFDDASLCLSAGDGNESSRSELVCQSVSGGADSSQSFTLEFDAWPTNQTGSQSLHVAVRDSGDDTVREETTVDLTVLSRDGDLDEDGLTNEQEVTLGTGLRTNDTDGDGLEDGIEVGTYGTNATSNDTDGDGLEDAEELDEYQTDPTASDTDDDGLDDDVEIEMGTDPNVADTDGDGLEDGTEVSRYDTDPTEPDTDGDGLDDGSEVRDHETNPLNVDTDGDGLRDNFEIYTYGTDPNAIDTDGDGLEDGTEVNEHRTDPTMEDSDGDDISDGSEINVHGTNPRKADTDGDGLEDGAEVNRYETDPLESDTDGDGVGDSEEVDRSVFASPMVSRVLAVGTVVALIAGGIFVSRTDTSPLSAVRKYLPATLSGTKPQDDERSESGERRYVDGSDGSDPADRIATNANDDAGTGASSGPEADGAEDGRRSLEDLDLDLMPNSEVVLTVLDEYDGQIRQSALVEETGWSKAKVSRVLSRMESDDEIVKVSVGRGNLITTPDDVPSGVRSPFDE